MKRKKKVSRTKDVLLADLWDNFTKCILLIDLFKVFLCTLLLWIMPKFAKYRKVLTSEVFTWKEW